MRPAWTLGWLLAILCWISDASAAPASFADTRKQYVPSEAWLLSRDGELLQQVRLDHTIRRLAWTTLEDISPALQRALIFSEDKHFYEHAGVDWNAAAAAGWRNLWSSKTRGASTLTMQLAGLLEQQADNKAGHTGRRTMLQKIGQTSQALSLESNWQKDQILEAYLNLVGFRGELQGVAAMSFGLFDKAPAALDARESALAAVLLRAPNVAPHRAAERGCELLKRLGEAEQCIGLGGFAALKLGGSFRISLPDNAPHFARSMLKDAGQTVNSTLDAKLQRFANQTLKANLQQLTHRNVRDGAVVVLDNQTGEVLAWVGSGGTFSDAAEVDAVVARRQAGSTLKPFLYAIALEQRALTAASLLDDSPVRIATPGGLYVPQDYDKHFIGPVSLRMALGNSLNVPAVRTLLRVGPDNFKQNLNRLGFDTLTEPGDYYGYSLALGSADVRLLDLANAYRTLANHGEWHDLIFLKGAVAQRPARKIYNPATAYIVSDILSDRNARYHTFGLDSALATRYWTAVKTGTSKDMRDNWCIGFSRSYTVAAWVGNAEGDPMHDVSGVTGAAPVWQAVMDYLHRDTNDLKRRSDAPPPVDGVETRKIRFIPALEPPRREVFVSGTAQSVITANAETVERLNGRHALVPVSLARVAYPGQGTIIALDPELPIEQERVVFRTSAPVSRGWQWILDDRELQWAADTVAWLPLPGKHKLVLQDENARVIDTVHFEVRGATAKTSELKQGR